MIKLYGIKNCGSVAKARALLDSKNIAYEFIDFKKTPPTLQNIHSWLEKSSMEILLNTKGTTYKKLGLKEKNLNDSQKIQAMLENPSLIKRPVIEIAPSNSHCSLIVGFDEAAILSALKSL
ncbi:arsenate reductase family protein [Helicobacter sp. MIT 00-7814]|uniref:arsenate reductase family protein n=1 Tax=unclassified Helicobacter TaxID=2593540 RepID=UPI000E1F16B3|nr:MULTISPECIES: Spx/MgsR family RNA polymerase-binding regulatory protein [unclassified Helicobacter]RDU53467.1 arsenate reductase family protein [Helicobacter sp. MIT 99-10781]RDU53764.1 arsenate reductase family protein [Helicobacter sp. MIT 00-7814]